MQGGAHTPGVLGIVQKTGGDNPSSVLHPPPCPACLPSTRPARSLTPFLCVVAAPMLSLSGEADDTYGCVCAFHQMRKACREEHKLGVLL
jgi:hypothetical protein